MKIKITMLQLLPEASIEQNLKKGLDACIEAKKLGADIALFPEMWSTGYKISLDQKELESQSINKNSNFILSFKKLAQELNLAIGITFLETNNPKPLNSVIFFDKKGNEVLHYSKVHTCDFDVEKVLSSGDDFYVADLDLGFTKVKIGTMICFDREFPESARVLMFKGAEIILAPNACVLWKLTGYLHCELVHMKTCWQFAHVIILPVNLIATVIPLFLMELPGFAKKTLYGICVYLKLLRQKVFIWLKLTWICLEIIEKMKLWDGSIGKPRVIKY